MKYLWFIVIFLVFNEDIVIGKIFLVIFLEFNMFFDSVYF